MMEKLDFENEEVEWKVNEIPVYGTFTRPKGEDPHSAVVFVGVAVQPTGTGARINYLS